MKRPVYFKYPRPSALFKISETSLHLLYRNVKHCYSMKVFDRLYITVYFILANIFMVWFLKSCKNFTIKHAGMKCFFRNWSTCQYMMICKLRMFPKHRQGLTISVRKLHTRQWLVILQLIKPYPINSSVSRKIYARKMHADVLLESRNRL
jgi:hypothetical protein